MLSTFVRKNITDEKYDIWMQGDGVKRTPCSRRNSTVTRVVEDLLENNCLATKDIPKVVKQNLGVSLTTRTIHRHFKRGQKNPQGYHSHVTPL